MKNPKAAEIINSMWLDPEEKQEIIIWLFTRETNVLELDDAIELLQYLSPEHQKTLIWNWVAIHGLNADRLKTIMSVKEIDTKQKLEIFKYWATSDNKNNITFADFKDCCRGIYNSDSSFEDLLTVSAIWFNRIKNTDETIKTGYLFNLIEEGLLLDGSGELVNEFTDFWIGAEFPLTKLSQFLDRIYPIQLLQKDFVNILLEKKYFNKSNYHEFLSEFMASLISKEYAQNVFAGIVKNIKLNLSRFEYLELLRERGRRQYPTITYNFKEFPLLGYLDENGNRKKGAVKEDNLLVKALTASNDLVNYTLADFFPYFEFDGFDKFLSCLTPDTKKEITKSFKIKPDQIYLSRDEFNKIEEILIECKEKQIHVGHMTRRHKENIDGNEINGVITSYRKFSEISLRKLSDYLLNRMPQVPVLNKEDIASYEINCATIEFEKGVTVFANVKEFNESFRELLNSTLKVSVQQEDVSPPNQKQILDFFSKAYNDNLSEVFKPETQKNFAIFFNQFKNEIAYLFTKEHGLDKFQSRMVTINHGCISNIGTQLNVILSEFLLEDPADQILFQMVTEKIIFPIINSGDDLIGKQAQFLENNWIKSKYVVVAEEFGNVLTKEFFDENRGKSIKNPAWDFIGNYTTQQQKETFQEELEYETDTEFNVKSAKLAANILVNQLIKNIEEVKDPKLQKEFEMLGDFLLVVNKKLKESLDQPSSSVTSFEVSSLSNQTQTRRYSLGN